MESNDDLNELQSLSKGDWEGGGGQSYNIIIALFAHHTYTAHNLNSR